MGCSKCWRGEKTLLPYVLHYARNMLAWKVGSHKLSLQAYFWRIIT